MVARRPTFAGLRRVRDRHRRHGRARAPPARGQWHCHDAGCDGGTDRRRRPRRLGHGQRRALANRRHARGAGRTTRACHAGEWIDAGGKSYPGFHRRRRARHCQSTAGSIAMMGASISLTVIIIFFLFLLASSLRVLREYERGVVFQLGRFWRVKGPGLVILIPVFQQMVRVGLRMVVMDVPAQDVISRDNVSVKVNAVLYFRVVDPQKAIIQVENFLMATSQLAQTTLRAVLGKHELDEMLAEREKLNLDIQRILDAQTEAWGIKVSNVEIKDVDINETMVRAIARQAEAERERRAKVIHAEGEQQAAEKLLEAAQMLAKQAEAMQLRYLQTLSNIAGDKTSTIVFPVPMDILTPLLEAVRKRNP